MDLKNIITQQGISIIAFTVMNEHYANVISKELTLVNIHGGDNFDDILTKLKTLNDTSIHVDEPLQNFIPHNDMSVPRYLQIKKFLEEVYEICVNNNLSVLFKSYIHTSSNTQFYKTSTGSNAAIMVSNFFGVVNGNKLKVEKNRFSQDKEYDLDKYLVRYTRQKKLINIDKNLNFS